MAERAGRAKVRLLSGGNPRHPKGDGDGPVEDWMAAVPDWKQAICARLDELIEQTVPNVTEGREVELHPSTEGPATVGSWPCMYTPAT